MQYNKPEVIALGSAASVVLGMEKLGPVIQDSILRQKTINAYEADE
jgi:hypothetical protein